MPHPNTNPSCNLCSPPPRDVLSILSTPKVDTNPAFPYVLTLTLNRTLNAGVVHRDLTPANILIQQRDELTTGAQHNSSELRVKLADFGLAKRKGVASSLMSSAVGTMPYSCPEIIQHEVRTHTHTHTHLQVRAKVRAKAKVRVEGCTTDARWARGDVLYVHSEFRARSSTFRS